MGPDYLYRYRKAAIFVFQYTCSGKNYVRIFHIYIYTSAVYYPVPLAAGDQLVWARARLHRAPWRQSSDAISPRRGQTCRRRLFVRVALRAGISKIAARAWIPLFRNCRESTLLIWPHINWGIFSLSAGLCVDWGESISGVSAFFGRR